MVKLTDPVEDVLHKFRKSDNNTIAVVDSDNGFFGIISREHLRPFLLNEKAPAEHTVSEIAINPPFTITPTDSVMKVVKMFDEANVWYLPLLNQERQFKGFVSRSKILKNYRSLLKDYSE